MVPSAGSSMWKGRLDFVATKWPRAYMIAMIIQAVICLGCEAYVFVRFQASLNDNAENQLSHVLDSINSQIKTIPTFLALFIFGFIYELILAWDALRMKNTIQVIGVCIANLALLVYTSLQIDQIKIAIEGLRAENALKPDELNVWEDSRPFLIAIPVILAFITIVVSFISWKLYQEFAWDILKQIGADYRMKKRFLHYQVYIALLKFDFFFFLGFTVQFLVIVTGKTDVEFALTTAAIPVTIAILLLAAFFTRRENKLGMSVIILLYFGALTYFVFKLVRIYQPGHKEHYMAVQRSLTAFAVLTIMLILLTITNALICMSNFNKGLKKHLLSKPDDEEKSVDAYPMHDQKPVPLTSRMTID